MHIACVYLYLCAYTYKGRHMIPKNHVISIYTFTSIHMQNHTHDTRQSAHEHIHIYTHTFAQITNMMSRQYIHIHMHTREKTTHMIPNNHRMSMCMFTSTHAHMQHTWYTKRSSYRYIHIHKHTYAKAYTWHQTTTASKYTQSWKTTHVIQRIIRTVYIHTHRHTCAQTTHLIPQDHSMVPGGTDQIGIFGWKPAENRAQSRRSASHLVFNASSMNFQTAFKWTQWLFKQHSNKLYVIQTNSIIIQTVFK
jgi:hypothetical protein